QGFVRIRLAIYARSRQIGQIEVLRLLGLGMKQELAGDGWNVGTALSRAEAAAAVAIYAGRLCPLHVQATLAFTAQRLTGGEVTEPIYRLTCRVDSPHCISRGRCSEVQQYSEQRAERARQACDRHRSASSS